MLSFGADIHHADNNGATPLILASGAGRLATVQALLDAGANSNLKDKHGNTALSFSTNNSDADVVELWLAHGAGTDGRARSKRFFQ